MNDQPSRLDLLYFARRVVVHQATAALNQLDRWIADEERREAERCQGEERRPPPPDWLLELGLNRNAPPVQVHARNCWNSGKRARGIGRGEALRALADGVRACSACRPDSELGFLD
ncbi:DUF6233 domain-containing protein [Streptomyces venetus]|uniref:DUF6233 domain-containing protein n=1 Tax=Streptomyces venetus TaxID=1701086 RepID=A0ABP8HI67_9ACTN